MERVQIKSSIIDTTLSIIDTTSSIIDTTYYALYQCCLYELSHCFYCKNEKVDLKFPFCPYRFCSEKCFYEMNLEFEYSDDDVNSEYFDYFDEEGYDSVG